MKTLLASALALLVIAGPAFAEGGDTSVRDSIGRVQQERVVFNAAGGPAAMTSDQHNAIRVENRRVTVSMPAASALRGAATGTENQNDH